MSLLVETSGHGVSVTVDNLTCNAQVEYVSSQLAEQIRLGYRRIHIFLAATAANAPGLQEMLQQTTLRLQQCAGTLTIESL